MWTTEEDPYKWYKENYPDLVQKGNAFGDEDLIFGELEEDGFLGELKNKWCLVFSGEHAVYADGYRQKDEFEEALYDWCLEHNVNEVDDLFVFKHGKQVTFDVRIND